jgi:ankyrin repeat protein
MEFFFVFFVLEVVINYGQSEFLSSNPPDTLASLLEMSQQEIEEVFREKPSLLTETNSLGVYTLLHELALGEEAEKSTDLMRICLTMGANPNARNAYSRHKTPLHFAAKAGNIEMAEILLDHGAGINTRDRLGRTPLDLAQDAQNTQTTELLLSRGAKHSFLSYQFGQFGWFTNFLFLSPTSWLAYLTSLVSGLIFLRFRTRKPEKTDGVKALRAKVDAKLESKIQDG